MAGVGTGPLPAGQSTVRAGRRLPWVLGQLAGL